MKRLFVLPLLAGAVSCQEGIVPPELEQPGVVAAAGGKAACPTRADYVVSDQPGLVAALAEASPGAVIGLDGFFEVTAQVLVGVNDLTLTCATPGSGVYGGGDFGDLFRVYADRVRIERLHFEAGEGLRSAILTGWADGFGSGDSPVVANNTFVCRSATCVWFNRSAGPTVVDNHFDISTAISVFSAIQIQQLTTDARVEGNTVIGPQESGQTGIRIRSGSNHVVVGNRVSGPWRQSLLAWSGGNVFQRPLSGSAFKSNELVGAQEIGLGLGGVVCDWTATEVATGELLDWCRWFGPASGNAVRNNRISGAGIAGIALDAACGNTIVGNNLQGNAENTGAIFGGVAVFDEVINGVRWVGSGNNLRAFPGVQLFSGGGTGDNSFAGNGSLVIDDGDLDCDRDGAPDPNLITGAGAVEQGASLGRHISGRISSGHPALD